MSLVTGIVRQGEIGKPFVVHTGIDLTGATLTRVRLVEPDGLTVHDITTGLSVLGNPTNGDISFSDTVGRFPDASDVGYWRVIARVTKSGVPHDSYDAGLFRVIGANA